MIDLEVLALVHTLVQYGALFRSHDRYPDSIQWSTTSSGSWDEKYPQLDTGNRGLPSPIPTELIFYPENPGDPFIMKPVSHSWADVSEMILHCVRRSQNIEYHPVCDQSLQLYQLIASIQDTETVLTIQDTKFVLATYTRIYNQLFFGGMVKSSVVEESADDEIKIIFDLHLVSDDVRAREVESILDNGLGLNLGLAKGIFDGRINRVTIYILDLVTLYPGRHCHEVISQMLGTLAHEMVHAIQLMYTKYPRDGLGTIYAPHATNFQKLRKPLSKQLVILWEGKGGSTRKSNLAEIGGYFAISSWKITRNRLTQRFETWGWMLRSSGESSGNACREQ
ncbi:uncharacterized protein EAF02_006040 [Botrytis sinoallii]|uniref:uncharacterized protein n=1 Tax=Botrytis sinoallii TaxID=1463999 RepID=UPI00190148A0|nr:uncharacterized protein EAF02_006040 [Botrytis sinoallii]KAF7882677.1 hypothetical protein EAF02_006040 [Botrytis sinoallii]